MELSYKWKMADLDKVEKNGCKVFSCFSCGGGSTMGYKLAGYEVIGNCEIDPITNAVYVENQHPKYNFNMDIRDFAKLEEYPEELKSLDILDGSPPCTTFSIAGEREKSWGKLKKFAEGNKEQRLDDLFFPFIALAKRLQPKVVIAENVKGLILKTARGYVNEIIAAFKDAGYDVQLFLLNASLAGVPQRRERVFFICHRQDLQYPKMVLNFNEKPILFGSVRTEEGAEITETVSRLMSRRIPTDRTLSDINQRLYNKNSSYTNAIIHDEDVCNTIASSGTYFRYYDGLGLTDADYVHVSTFPEDYKFGKRTPHFLCGMSVPPLLAARIAGEVYKQWLRKK